MISNIILSIDDLNIINYIKNKISSLTGQDAREFIREYVKYNLSSKYDTELINKDIYYLISSGNLYIEINNQSNDYRKTNNKITINTHDFVNLIVASDQNYVSINQTQAGRILCSLEFRVLVEATFYDFNSSLNYQIAFDYYFYNGENSLFGIISANYAANISGDVFIITPFSDLERIFTSVELQNILNNNSITSINGISIGVYRNIYINNIKDGLHIAESLKRVNSVISITSTDIIFNRFFNIDFICQNASGSTQKTNIASKHLENLICDGLSLDIRMRYNDFLNIAYFEIPHFYNNKQLQASHKSLEETSDTVNKSTTYFHTLMLISDVVGLFKNGKSEDAVALIERTIGGKILSEDHELTAKVALGRAGLIVASKAVGSVDAPLFSRVLIGFAVSGAIGVIVARNINEISII